MLTNPGNTSMDRNIQTGLRWSAIRQVVLSVTTTIGVLAYIQFLKPEDLGAAGLAFLVSNGLFLLIEAPIRDAVVYYQKQGKSHESAAFWLLVGFSSIAVFGVLLGSNWFARLYNSPIAAGLTRGIVVAFFFQSMAVVPKALLLKQFRFAIHEILQTVFVLLTLAGWVGLSMAGFGAWSLILPNIVSSIFLAIATWAVTRFQPLMHPEKGAYADILRFSRSVFGSKLITYFRENIDNAAVGTLGTNTLGQYKFGEDQSAGAVISVGAMVAHIALPALATVREKAEDFKQIYLTMLRLTATLSTPMQIGALVLADLGITLLFGEQWRPSIPVFRAYIIFRLFDTLFTVTDAATSAVGRPDIRFKVDLLQLPFFGFGIWFGLQVWGGIVGIAWSLSIVRSIAGIVYFLISRKVTYVERGDTIAHVWPSSVAGALMGASVWILRPMVMDILLRGNQSASHYIQAMQLILLISTGAGIYFLFLYLLDRKNFKVVARQIWGILRPQKL